MKREVPQPFLAIAILVLSGSASSPATGKKDVPEVLPGTAPLLLEGDIASELVAGADRFLLREIERSVERRSRYWERDVSSREAYAASVAPNRERFAWSLGVRDRREPVHALEMVTTTRREALVGRGEGFRAYAVRWPVFRGVEGEGLLLVPEGREPVADVVALPDADRTPEMLAGLVPGVPPESRFAKRLAESGCRVVVPVLIDRGTEHSRTMMGERRTRLSHREFLYRPAFELGRHIIGYEVQKALALVDFFANEAEERGRERPVGVFGHGEGGLIALAAGALDARIDVTGVSGHFAPREEVWKEPIYRNVFRLLEEFGDAEIASLVAPRALVVEAARGPELVVPPGTGGGPGRLETPSLGRVRSEVERARGLLRGLEPAPSLDLVASGNGSGPYGSEAALRRFLDLLAPGNALVPPGGGVERLVSKDRDGSERLVRQLRQIERDTQELLRESPYVRREFWKRADRSSPDRWVETTGWYRDYFRDRVIGRFGRKLIDANPRSRRAYEGDGWIGYEVVLDVFPGVIAYGILLVPRGIDEGERRPVVVCQHGLEGRPQHVIGEEGYRHYKAFAAKLAERGFVTFAPQNLYIFGDRFRTLQRKANPLGKTLFSIIVPQHRQITGWLASLPYVDPDRIGFYGLSYGGKTAMRVPPLVERYCLSICSADFNDWIWKNASTRSRYSYVSTGEYEIFEFDLGNTFNYAEMAGLIAPRPFMVERGHRDGVAPDERVAHEFAKVRLLYADLGIAERARIEFFDGPHTIHGEGTFEFLEEFLRPGATEASAGQRRRREER